MKKSPLEAGFGWLGGWQVLLQKPFPYAYGEDRFVISGQIALVDDVGVGAEAILKLRLVSDIGDGSGRLVKPTETAELRLKRPIRPFHAMCREVFDRLFAVDSGSGDALVSQAL